MNQLKNNSDWIPPWEDLREMMNKAKKEGLIFIGYQGIKFTADELQQKWNKGRFRWGAINWKLIQPPNQ